MHYSITPYTHTRTHTYIHVYEQCVIMDSWYPDSLAPPPPPSPKEPVPWKTLAYLAMIVCRHCPRRYLSVGCRITVAKFCVVGALAVCVMVVQEGCVCSLAESV